MAYLAWMSLYTPLYLSKVSCDLEIWLKVKSDITIGFAIYDFLFIANTSTWPILLGYASTAHSITPKSAVTLKFASRSNLMLSLESPYMISYSLLIHLHCLTCSLSLE